VGNAVCYEELQRGPSNEIALEMRMTGKSSITRDSSAGGGRAEHAYATIYSVLRDHLERKLLRAGLVVGQASVARAFNVSRVPAGIALARLLGDGMIGTFGGKGYIVPGGEPLRISLKEGGLEIPVEAATPPISRREQIYPEVEHAVAICLAYGRFLLNESALAQHYDVSRTVAHEVLAQLERAGVIEQDSNNRWYAGPLSAAEFKHHYEMRIFLEPQALRQAFPFLRDQDLRQRLQRIREAEQASMLPANSEELEADLHVHTLQPCPNSVLLNALRRSQRVLIATHSTFADHRKPVDIELMASEHARTYAALLEKNLEQAASILEEHLARSIEVNLGMLSRLGPLPESRRPPYLIQVRA
jgi:DNA-binding GntR family transcriptional regulator